MTYKHKNNGDFDGAYSSEWVNDNLNNVLKGELVKNWLLTEVPYLGQFKAPKFNVELNIWVESASVEELQKEAIRLGKETIKTAYDFHRNNGFKYAEEFENFLAEEVLIYKKITESQALEIGSFFKMVLLIITRGQWKSAKKEIDILPDPETYMQPYFSKLNTYVNEYISTKYSQ